MERLRNECIHGYLREAHIGDKTRECRLRVWSCVMKIKDYTSEWVIWCILQELQGLGEGQNDLGWSSETRQECLWFNERYGHR